jgi:hypothetical protein
MDSSSTYMGKQEMGGGGFPPGLRDLKSPLPPLPWSISPGNISWRDIYIYETF